jgi:hypothetical protein
MVAEHLVLGGETSPSSARDASACSASNPTAGTKASVWRRVVRSLWLLLSSGCLGCCDWDVVGWLSSVSQPAAHTKVAAQTKVCPARYSHIRIINVITGTREHNQCNMCDHLFVSSSFVMKQKSGSCA